jgi:hypothetical protein
MAQDGYRINDEVPYWRCKRLSSRAVGSAVGGRSSSAVRYPRVTCKGTRVEGSTARVGMGSTNRGIPPGPRYSIYRIRELKLDWENMAFLKRLCD